MKILGVGATQTDRYMTDDPTFPDPKKVWRGKRYHREYDEDEVREWAARPRTPGRPTGEDAQRRAKARRERGWED